MIIELRFWGKINGFGHFHFVLNGTNQMEMGSIGLQSIFKK